MTPVNAIPFTAQERRRMRLFETFDLQAGEQLLRVIAAPIDRLLDLPPWVKLLSLIVALVQYVQTDMFGGSLALVIVVGVIDYWCGVKAARYLGVWDARMAHAGAMGKITGVMLLLVTRLIEHLVYTQNILNTHGAVAAAIGASLALVDVQSIAHHRETFGAKPIPILGRCLDFLRAAIETKFPAGGK